MSGNYSTGRAKTWAFRWHQEARPGMYILTLEMVDVWQRWGCEFLDSFHSNWTSNFDAIVDDFGNLVVIR